MVRERFTGQLTITTTIEGEIRHRRKLSKDLFFIDVLLSDGAKDQILFRSDDGTLTREAVQDYYRAARLGNVIRAEVGLPTDLSEYTSKPYKVWQSNVPLVVVRAYDNPKTFVADPPLGSNGPKSTIRRWDGSRLQKAELYCKFWINQRECVRLPDCPFLHPTEEEYEQARKEWIDDRMAVRKITTHDPHDPHTSKKSHGMRAMVFAQWVAATFFGDHGGSSEQREDTIVLDVAGGKGDVSMFLSHAFGIPSVVVEPEARKRPRHWFTRLRRIACRITRGEDPETCTAPMVEEWPFEIEPRYIHTFLDDAFIETYPDILSKTGLLIGMHADQATEPIVDIALRLEKPFAVVPCCVFGHENRGRRLKNGGEVATTKDLIQYLCEKDTRGRGKIETAYLGFEGKNVVVFWHPNKEK
ncbi:hypothetical protein BX666DRAFT_1847308 [Dichotomocladium elegans]|nr:hypothetical protein BX666DRAFT_1847308 [Dichotomocladium elegans]